MTDTQTKHELVAPLLRYLKELDSAINEVLVTSDLNLDGIASVRRAEPAEFDEDTNEETIVAVLDDEDTFYIDVLNFGGFPNADVTKFWELGRLIDQRAAVETLASDLDPVAWRER